ncbi:MAG: FtsX-like permease family protein [Polyangiaceae bacterium]
MIAPRSLAIFGHAVSALLRRKGKVFALGGGLMLVVALVAAVLFLTDALKGEADRARSAIPDVVVQRLVAGRPTLLDAKDAEAIAPIPSVASVTPRVWGYLFLPSLQGNVTIVGVPHDAPTLEGVRGTLQEGRDLVHGKHEMVAGAGIARYLGLLVGDSQGLPTPNHDASPLTLVGTFASPVELFTTDVILCDEDDARAILLVPPGQATDVAVRVVNAAETRVIARTILAKLPGTRVVERDLLGRVYALAYGRRAGIVLAASIPAILALFVLAWDRASGFGADERQEIAVLKAVGWSTSDVLWAKLYESVLVGFVATALGILIAYGWVFLLGAPGLRPTLVGWSVLYPEEPLTPMVDFAQILGLGLAIVGPFVALSIVPAWRAATTDPMDTMRG